jgi:ribosomal protein S18 acetylase RimI-like enzyme
LTDSLDFRFLETSNDFRQLEPFAASIWEQHYTPIIGADQVAFMLDKYQSAKAMSDQFSAGYKYAVVICGDQKAGYFAFDGKAKKEVFISKLYIHKDFRRRGLGRHILDFIAKETRALGCAAMTLSVNKDNSDSIQFYLAYGFQTIKAQKVAIGEGFYMDDYVMSCPVKRE